MRASPRQRSATTPTTTIASAPPATIAGTVPSSRPRARLGRAELVRHPDEHVVHRADPAADRVGHDHLLERQPDHHRDVVERAAHHEEHERERERASTARTPTVASAEQRDDDQQHAAGPPPRRHRPPITAIATAPTDCAARSMP